MSILVVGHPVQDITHSIYFNCFFHKSLSDPEWKNKVINDEFLNKKTIENIINEIFSTNVEQNKKEIQNFKKE